MNHNVTHAGGVNENPEQKKRKSSRQSFTRSHGGLCVTELKVLVVSVRPLEGFFYYEPDCGAMKEGRFFHSQ